ncbi:nitroreductase family protein [Paenibacillus sp. FSL M7-0420]|uniref:nitroreductase family protein n=1 Tax=Paenibacillus sp. FSL M7-0420 TaxID=2921609 RepID=UPI0030FC8A2A
MTPTPDSLLIRTIRDRRTIQEFNGMPIARSTLLNLLDNAVWAPFHSKKEPWRFILYTWEDRTIFADAILKTRPEAFVQQFGAQIHDTYCRRQACSKTAYCCCRLADSYRRQSFG